jgi:hypothetical protein
MYKPKKIHAIPAGQNHAVGESVTADCGKELPFVPFDHLESGHQKGEFCDQCPQGPEWQQIVEYL